MNKITLLSISYLLASGVATASTSLPCTGFKVIVKNNLGDRIVSTKVKMDNADVTPNFVQIDKQSEKTFIVYPTTENDIMTGKFIFKTVSAPPKNIHIDFELKNKLAHCSHTGKDTPNAYPVNYKRSPGAITYTIG